MLARNCSNFTTVCKISTSVTQDTPSVSEFCSPSPSPQSRSATRWIPASARPQYRRARIHHDQGISDREVLDDWHARAYLAHILTVSLLVRRKEAFRHLVSHCLDSRARCRLDITNLFRLYALCYQVRTSHLLGYSRRNLSQCMAARGEVGTMEVSCRV